MKKIALFLSVLSFSVTSCVQSANRDLTVPLIGVCDELGCNLSVEMVRVQGGVFKMGATDGQGGDARADEGPVHQVTLSDYYISKYEVTWGLALAVMLDYPCDLREAKEEDGYGDYVNCPADGLSWDDAQLFIQKLNEKTGLHFSLPTEAQWEYAARGGNKSKGYKYSGGNSISDVAWYGEQSEGFAWYGEHVFTHPVGGKAPNELGIYDMSGNVAEWCADWYGDYSADSQTNPQGPSSGFYHVLRGGSWDDDVRYCRVSARRAGRLRQLSRPEGYGLRLVLPHLELDREMLDLGASGEEQTVTVISSRGFKVKPDSAWSDRSDWLHVARASGGASGTYVKFTAKANKSETPRSARVIFKSGDVKRPLWVVQAGTLPSPVFVERAFGTDMEMVQVKGGTFWMGAQSTDADGRNYDSEARNWESPVHQVTLSDYYIGKYEVTQAQWKAVMGTNPSEFKKGDDYPVENVSWNDVQLFIQKLNEKTGKRYALPTEAQWEYAARGGSMSHGYKYSGGTDVGEVAWYFPNSSGSTRPVGTKSPNELGIYDMSGNVEEWCVDWYDGNYYQVYPSPNPCGLSSGSHRVIRGGGWDDDVRYCRVSARSNGTPGTRDFYYGFRLALLP